MAVTLSFLAGENFTIYDATGSGIGMFGNGWNVAVPVNSYQSRSFITNSDGTIQGPEVDNVKWAHPSSGILGQAGSPVELLRIPNYMSSLELRLVSDVAIRVQNAQVIGYDRVSTSNPPSGLTFQMAEIIHPDNVQNLNGSGDSSWVTMLGTGSYLTLAPCPGISGLYAGNGSNSTRPDTTHSWYLAQTAKPSSIGTKLFALNVSFEYL